MAEPTTHKLKDLLKKPMESVGITAAVTTVVGYTSGLIYGFFLRVLYGPFIRIIYSELLFSFCLYI
jgi:hypothetical protein